MYIYFSNGLTWHIYIYTSTQDIYIYILCACTRRKVNQAACEVPAKSDAQEAMVLCSLWTTDLKNAKFNCNTIHINMGQHVLVMLHLV